MGRVSAAQRVSFLNKPHYLKNQFMKSMKKLLLLALVGTQAAMYGQSILTAWNINTTGATASYWENANGNPTNPSFVFHTLTDSADVQRVCYTTDSVYVKATGTTDSMGQFLNPGGCSAQTFVYCFPRNPAVATTKSSAPASFAIGSLLNGVPIFGRGAGTSWGGSGNINGGPQVWNTEVYKAEGFVLDNSFGAHPQQQGMYHTHATPFRYYEDVPTNVHSPLVGFAFDGYPIYGPYGYSSAMNASSGVTRMKTGYSLRNITVRTTLPDGSTASQSGPPVNTTYPIGTYCEDYEWLAANGGDLDQYNGRFCVTPEYPGGIYAYFVTQDAAGTPQYPYYIGPQYYGKLAPGNVNGGCTSRTWPTSGLTCYSPTGIFSLESGKHFVVFPNPNTGQFTIQLNTYFATANTTVNVYNTLGQVVYSQPASETFEISLDRTSIQSGIYFVHLVNASGKTSEVQKIVVQ
jgi:hypothetical protein